MPGASQILVPLYRILVDGQELDPVEADAVHQIKITDFLRLPDICTLQVGYPADDGPDPFKNLDDSKFEVGAALEVKLGGTDDRVTKSIFKGEIVTVEPDFQAGGASMVVRAYDWSHRMMRSRKQRTFVNVKVSDIVKKDLQRERAPRSGEAAPGGQLDIVVQNSESDWDFIWRLAQRIGFELTVNDRMAVFKPPDRQHAGGAGLSGRPARLPSPDHRGAAGADRQRARVRLQDQAGRHGHRVHAATGHGGRDHPRSRCATSSPAPSSRSAGSRSRPRPRRPTIAQATLDQLANALSRRGGRMRRQPADQGRDAGSRSAASGSKYSGTYRVAKAVHMLTAGGYVTQFSNSAGEHTLLGQSGGANGGPRRVDSIVVGIVTNNQRPRRSWAA